MDELFLKQKSEIATKADADVIWDLMATLRENVEYCVGNGCRVRLSVWGGGI